MELSKEDIAKGYVDHSGPISEDIIAWKNEVEKKSNNLKILILVLSFTDEPYLSLMRSQQQTFDSIEVEGVRTVYYYGGGKGWVNDKEFSADASDEYYYMTKKCLEALKEVFKTYRPDVIFRTNSSSYVQKSRLVEFIKTLPKEKLFAGWEIQGDGQFNVISGAGIFMTPDVADLLIEHADPEFCREEDCYISEVLYGQGIKIIDDKSRYDVPITIPDDMPLDRYHYRLKSGPANRLADIGNMRQLHKLIHP